MSKMDQYREVLREANNLRLFEEVEEGFRGSINIPKLRQRFFVMLSLPENSFYNEISIVLATMPSEKMDDALVLINELNAIHTGDAFYIIPGNKGDEDFLIFYRTAYTALKEDFDPHIFDYLLVTRLDELPEDSAYKEIMRLYWE